MKHLTTLVTVGLLTVFCACSKEEAQTPNDTKVPAVEPKVESKKDQTPKPNDPKVPAAGLTHVELELPEMD